MSRAASVVIPLRGLGPRGNGRAPTVSAGLAFVIVAGACIAAAALTSSTSLHRHILAAVLAANLIAIGVRSPRLAALLMLAYLPVMAMIRRLMISEAPWTSQDPLLLVVPVVVVFLCAQLLVIERRPILHDRAAQVVLALIAIAIIQVANPRGAGLMVGAGGLLFIAVPLGWFFLGRELADRATVRLIMIGATGLGVIVGGYGLLQTEVGFPFWDHDWLDVVLADFQSLNVGTQTSGTTIRAFGPFSSASEYMSWLGATIVFAVALFFDRRSPVLLLVPIVAVALFFGSGRSITILTAFAVIAMIALHVLRGRRALLVILTGTVVIIVALIVLGPSLSNVAAGSRNPLVAHQASGLGDPFNESSSTFMTHLRAAQAGIVDGIAQPLGTGTGSTTHATEAFGSTEEGGTVTVTNDGVDETIRGTDMDISNMFLGLGAAGGLVYLALLFVIARRLLGRYSRRPDPILLGVLGFLIVLTGGWLRGEHYAISALAWFLIGWATQPGDHEDTVEPNAPAAMPRAAGAPTG